MLKNILCATSLLCAATVSQAATITLTDTVALQSTNYGTTLSFANFDDDSGNRILESVTFSIDGEITGTARIENLDTTLPLTVVANLSAELSLTDALGNELVVTIPSVSTVFNATAFDGTLDFGGTSGLFIDNLSATQSNSQTYTDTATLNMFTGAGVSSFTFDAIAASIATGSGNVSTGLTTQAMASIEVIYTYSEAAVSVSAPSHVALLGLGLVGFAGLRKLRK